MSLPKSFNSKSYPKVIRAHKSLKSCQPSKIKKVFSIFGLQDGKTKISRKKYFPPCPTPKKIALEIVKFITDWENRYSGSSYVALTNDTKTNLSVLKQVITNNPESIIGNKALKLPHPIDISISDQLCFHNNIATFHSQNDLLGMIMWMIKMLDDQFEYMYAQEKELYDTITLFYLHNFSKPLYMVFASNGSRGAWDMSTMSMRGIRSCQSWNKSHSHQLVGSIIDPCAGILYLTDGSPYKKKGSKMFARSIVRFVINQNYKPEIFIERSYASFPFEERGHYVGAAYLDIFERFLNAKLDDKITVKRVGKSVVSDLRIPLSDQIFELSAENWSYRDSGVRYTEKVCTKLPPAVKSVLIKSK